MGQSAVFGRTLYTSCLLNNTLEGKYFSRIQAKLSIRLYVWPLSHSGWKEELWCKIFFFLSSYLVILYTHVSIGVIHGGMVGAVVAAHPIIQSGQSPPTPNIISQWLIKNGKINKCGGFFQFSRKTMATFFYEIASRPPVRFGFAHLRHVHLSALSPYKHQRKSLVWTQMSSQHAATTHEPNHVKWTF